MKSKRFLSFLLSLIMLISAAPMVVLADDTQAPAVQSVEVTLTAQADGAFLCAPQIDVSVSSDTAENYGFTDSIADGVSALDALVKLHEVKYGSDFTKDTASSYLAVSNGTMTKLFANETMANGFVLNGAFPNDGTESQFGGYNGTTVTTQKLSDGDTVEFLIYQDKTNWSDELAWFAYKGNAVTEITVTPGIAAKLNLKSSSYMMSYQYIDAEAIHAVGSSVAGAQLALVNADSSLTAVQNAVTDTNGDVTVTAPAAEGTYYLTAYMPSGTEGEPLIMSLTKIVVDKNAPQEDPSALSALSVASFDSNPNALSLTPAFDPNTTEYSVPVVEFPTMDLGVFRSVYVKAAAQSDEATVTATCNDVTVTVTDASNWTMLNGALIGGKNNILTITVAASADENLQTKTYTVTVPMKPQTNTAPTASAESGTASVMLGETYSIDLSEIFTDADEVDTLTYKVSVNDAEAVAAEEAYTFTPDAIGEYTLVFTANDGTADSDTYTVTLTVTANIPKPTSLTIQHNAKDIINDVIVTKKGDKFKLTAYDENGNETPVTWANTSFGGGGVTLDENTGDIEVTGDIYSSTSYLYFTATSTLDPSVTQKITIKATGYLISEYQKATTIALSEDGQTAKTASITAGQSGHNIWSYTIPDGVGELAADPGNSNSIKFNVFRPGVISVSFKLDINEELTDTATITVTGVAVEDADGNNGKTYLTVSTDNPTPTVQLTAYVAEGRTVASWTSADETIATVDANGLVTAKGVGSTIITATDSDGAKGGIKVVVDSAEIPYFESLEFATTAFTSGAWVKDSTFVPTKLEYDLPIKTYSTSSLTLQATTLYDTDKYTAVAEYTDVNGEKQSVTVNSGKATTLANQPFDSSVLTITISDKNNAEKKTVYTFNVTRPRDTTKQIKSNGIVLAPTSRALSSTTYNGVAEGTMQKCDENGTLTSGTGVSSSANYYRTFIYSDAESFKLTLSASTNYAHIRYSTDNGATWKEVAEGSGVTEAIALPGETATAITVQILDDAAYTANVNAGKDGFADCQPTEYKVWVDTVTLTSPKMLTAEVTGGDWYPAFSSDMFSYWVVIANDAEAPVLTYTVADGSTVKIGTTEQTPDENGKYTLELGTSQKSITVTSEDGSFTNTYKFAYKKKSAMDVPDKVVDYLCMGSQYTNAGYGTYPEQTLGGSLKSLGNFGGYITYYYENPITDNPNNKYGMDFYVVGNSMENNIDSMAELGQVYVSEDGKTWYALAGSEHYEDKAIWDYTITYTKGDDGKAYWTDNQGNSIDYAAKAWPSAAYYYMNNAASSDTYTFTGVVFKSQLGNIMGDSTSTASFAASVKFGYADYYASNISGTTVTDVNSYAASPSKANGFDVAWAVDDNGIPVDVSEMEFHYIKVATASNIFAGMFAEKSTEVTYVVRTTAQDTAVGKTTAPTGVTISDGADSKTVNFTEGQTVYSVNLDGMKYVSVTVNETADDDNIYVNNQRVASGIAAEGFKVTKEKGETLVRVIVQNGDKEPVIYLLKLTSSAEESDELIEGIKINADGTVREATTKNGTSYTASVGYRIDSISIGTVAAQNVSITVNGEAKADAYALAYGDNTFEIVAVDADGNTQTVVLTVTREEAPASTGKTITVKFKLYGDEVHGDDAVHTYKNDKSKLPVWISQKSYTVDAGSTVLDVFEMALTDADLTWENDGGNYISEINGLAEFDNGSLSGWMYTLNGSYPDLGVAEQTLKNGDKIIFHYTDDYTQEKGSEKWDSVSSDGSTKTYIVKFETNGGNTIKSQTLEKNEKVEEPNVPAKDGYTFVGWYTDKALTQEYDFDTKVTKGFTLYAKWEKKAAFDASTFADVAKDAWYYDSVRYVYENGLMQGSDGNFDPDGSMTRAMIVTVLYRLDGVVQTEKNSGFTDVADDAWYADAIAWAAENGIIVGISETEFAPDANITREQLAAVIYRYAKFKGYDISAAASLGGYADADAISEYALDAFAWAVGEKLIKGTDETTISPKMTSTRAHVATILMRFCENIK